MIHSYGDRHLQTSAGFFISAPIDDGLIVEISVREFYVKCFIGYPGDVGGIEPVWVVLHVKEEFSCLLGILYVSVTSFVEGSVVRVVFGINGCAGFRILVEDILAWVDLVIYDYLVCLPEISHSVVLPGVQYFRQQVEEVDVEFCPRFAGVFYEFRDVNPVSYGYRGSGHFCGPSLYVLSVIVI